MCYSAEISFNTYVFGTIIAIILLLLNKTPIIIIYFAYTVSLIQLMEYLIWINMNNPNYNDSSNINIYYLSIIGSLILLIQILIINIYYLEGIERIIIIILIIILFSYLSYYNTKYTKNIASVGKNGHLIWHWIDVEYVNVIGLFFWIYPLIRSENYLLLLVIIPSLLFSVYNYYKYKTFGSMWCYIGNIVWLLLLFNAILLLLR